MPDKELNLKPLLPNGVTMLALAFGVSSINMAFWGAWHLAVIFIALAGVFDFLDGKVARMLNVSSRFGAELDSLSDFVSFGVAPAFLMYLFTMNNDAKISVLQNLSLKSDAVGVHWIFVLFVSMCAATRLARFNAMLDEKQESYWKYFFMGVPAPAGAFLTMMPLILWLASNQQVDFFREPIFASIFLVFSGLMMGSKIPTLCLKYLPIPQKYTTILWMVLLFVIAGMISFPWQTLSVLGIGYIISIPVCVYYFLKLKKAKLNK